MKRGQEPRIARGVLGVLSLKSKGRTYNRKPGICCHEHIVQILNQKEGPREGGCCHCIWAQRQSFHLQALAGAYHQLRSENFGVKRTVVKAADPKILGQLLKNFLNTDPVDRTHRTSKRKGGLAGKHPREGRGVWQDWVSVQQGGGVKMADAPV